MEATVVFPYERAGLVIVIGRGGFAGFEDAGLVAQGGFRFAQAEQGDHWLCLEARQWRGLQGQSRRQAARAACVCLD